MAQSLRPKISQCCWRTFLREQRPEKHCRRSMVTIQRGRPEKLNLPPEIPQSYWAQLPERLRPDRVKRKIVVHQPPPAERKACSEPLKFVDEQHMEMLDPAGARRKLFDIWNKDSVKVGDIMHITFKTGEPFSGVLISIKSRGPQTSILLRNHLTRVGTEMQVKVYSPLVQSMEIVQRAVKRARRARLYYLRKPKHDIGSVEKIVEQHLRQRAMLVGGKRAGQHGARRQGKRK